MKLCRGNTPFCSKECRQEQIEFDEAKEKSWKISSRSLRKSDTNKNSSTPSKTSRTGTVVVAWVPLMIINLYVYIDLSFQCLEEKKRKGKKRTGKWKRKWNQNFPCWKFDEGVCIMSLWSVKGEKGLVWDHQEEINFFFFDFFFFNLVGLDWIGVYKSDQWKKGSGLYAVVMMFDHFYFLE